MEATTAGTHSVPSNSLRKNPARVVIGYFLIAVLALASGFAIALILIPLLPPSETRFPYIAIAASFMVSYATAKAEAECPEAKLPLAFKGFAPASNQVSEKLPFKGTSLGRILRVVILSMRLGISTSATASAASIAVCSAYESFLARPTT